MFSDRRQAESDRSLKKLAYEATMAYGITKVLLDEKRQHLIFFAREGVLNFFQLNVQLDLWLIFCMKNLICFRGRSGSKIDVKLVTKIRSKS